MIQSCQETDSLSVNQEKDDLVEIKFDLDILKEEFADTRAASPYELHVLIFDGKGQGIDHQVLDLKNTNWVRLPRMNDSAIIHFVWVESGFQHDIDKAFSADEFIGMHEGEAINAISSQRELYWARVEVPSLLQNSNLGRVELLKNKARISVKNGTTKSNLFEILGFTVHNVPSYGTLAPFNSETSKFEKGVITEAYPRVMIPFAPMDASENLLVPENQVQFTLKDQSMDIFERGKSSLDDELFLIVKAKYKNKQYYYKLGFYDSERLVRIALERNHHYVINIMKVEQAGYTSLQEAIRNAPAENAGLSILLQEYTQISDGKSSLTVSSTALSFHQPNEELELSYSYIEKNRYSALEPQIELIQHDGFEVIKPSSFSYTYNFDRSKREHSGKITGVTLDNLPSKYANTGIIRVRIGDLVRDVRLDLGPKKELNAQLISLGSRVDDKVYIEFTINKSDVLSKTIFPLNFYIDTQYLYPDTDYGYNSNLSLAYDGKHHHYQYIAREAGVHRVYFKRNLSGKSEVIRIKSGHYHTKDLSLIGEDNGEPYIANGLIYIGANQQERLDKDAQVWAEPEDMPRSFWLPKTGEYSFQFDKRRVYAGHKVSFYAETKDGRSYKATYPYEYFTANKPVISLLAYPISSIVYAYYGIGTNQVLDMRAYNISCSHPGINVSLNTDDIYRVNALNISLNSDVPDNKEIIFYASYKNGWNEVLYQAVTTAKKIKRNQGLDFTYIR